MSDSLPQSFGKPAQLKHVLQRLVRSKGLAEESAQKHLDEIWKTTAGERVASKSFVRRLRAGVLEVGVRNGTILEELTCYLHHDLLVDLQKRHPDPPINSLKFIKIN